jgi:hypothetical protein
MTTFLERRVPIAFLLAGGVLAIGVSAALLRAHALQLASVQNEALPIAAQIPLLERRLQLLGEQVDVAELHTATEVGSKEEEVRAYVLPDSIDLTRALALLEGAGDELHRRGTLRSMSKVEPGEIAEITLADGKTVRTQSLAVTVTVNDEGLRSLLSLLELSGYLTVSDALRDEELKLLFERTEAENPAGIVTLEQFLATDLLSYAHDPRGYDEKLLRSFPSETFASALKSIVGSSLLQEAKSLFQDSLFTATKKFWPLPFVTVQKVILGPAQSGGFQEATLSLAVYARK